MSGPDFNAAFNLLHLVHVECLGRRTIDHRSGCDVEAGAVALAHDRCPCEPPTGERTRRRGAGAEIVEGVKAIVDTRDRDSPLAVLQVEGNDEVVGDRVARADRAKGSSGKLGHRVLLSSARSKRIVGNDVGLLRVESQLPWSAGGHDWPARHDRPDAFVAGTQWWPGVRVPLVRPE